MGTGALVRGNVHGAAFLCPQIDQEGSVMAVIVTSTALVLAHIVSVP